MNKIKEIIQQEISELSMDSGCLFYVQMKLENKNLTKDELVSLIKEYHKRVDRSYLGRDFVSLPKSERSKFLVLVDRQETFINCQIVIYSKTSESFKFKFKLETIWNKMCKTNQSKISYEKSKDEILENRPRGFDREVYLKFKKVDFKSKKINGKENLDQIITDLSENTDYFTSDVFLK